MAVNTTSATRKRRKIDGKHQATEKKAVPVPVPVPPLPKDLYVEVAKYVHESESLAFSMTCRDFSKAMKEVRRARKEKAGTKSKRLTTSQKYYMENEGVPVSEDWIKWAFSMKWEYPKKSRYNEDKKKGFLVFLAARCGHKDLLGWLKSRGCRLGVNACHGAAQGGHIEALKYLKSEGQSFDRWTCWDAALGGHIKVLEYLKNEEGVSFDKRTCRRAALNGHLHVLKYLRSERVPLDSDCYRCAAYGCHLHVLEWLRSQGCPSTPLVGAGRSGKFWFAGLS
jgi:hypothetical protein